MTWGRVHGTVEDSQSHACLHGEQIVVCVHGAAPGPRLVARYLGGTRGYRCTQPAQACPVHDAPATNDVSTQEAQQRWQLGSFRRQGSQACQIRQKGKLPAKLSPGSG